MTRQWAYGMALLLGLTAAGLARAWQPGVLTVGDLLPPAPADYMDDFRIIIPESPVVGRADIVTYYKPLDSSFPFDTITLIVTGEYSEYTDLPPEIWPELWESLPEWAMLPDGPDIDGSRADGQRYGFPEVRRARASVDPYLNLVAYQVDISFSTPYIHSITALRWAPPPFRAEEFQPLDDLLDQIYLPALAALGG